MLFLNKSFDELVVDPTNEELIEAHIPMLKAETNGTLSASAKNILGSTFYDTAKNNSGRLPKFVRPQFSSEGSGRSRSVLQIKM